MTNGFEDRYARVCDALILIEPAIMALLNQKPNGAGLAITMLDPTADTEVALIKKTYGSDPKTWERPFAEFADLKASLSWKHKTNSYDLRYARPHLYIPGDLTFGEGVYFEGIVVGTSGCFSWEDEMVSTWLAAAYRSLSKGFMEVSIFRDKTAFIPKS